MEDEKGAAGIFCGPSSSADTPPPPPSNPTKDVSQRQRFTAELRPGETTIVSWRKFLKDCNKGSGPAPDPPRPDPALESGAGPDAPVQPVEGEPKDAVPPPNRFSAVVEKIERLYMGKQSSDEEELDDAPDDDQYDTEDSFIDDAELDEYFQVDKLETKHDGYFVNRGKLEQIEPSSSSNLAPKKRKRKDSTKNHSENDEHIPTESVNMGNMRIKAAARSAPLAGRKQSCPTKTVASVGEHYRDIKHLESGTFKKKSADFATKSENRPPVKISKDVSLLPLESKNFYKRKTGVISSRDPAHNASREKGVFSQVEPKPKKLLNGDNGIEDSTKIRRKERNGIGELPDLNSSGNAYPMQTTQQPSMRVKEGFIVRPKGTMLERAIRDLENIVTGSRPPNYEIQEVDTSAQAIKRRLPQEVKQKLAKVARLSASQGKISEDALTDRLMGILGHLVQRKTLKRNMKELVELGLSAKKQKADRFQQIKKEVHEMIKAHTSLMKSKVSEMQDSSADDFMEDINNDERISLEGNYSMDKALEDKICDLYDLYVEGMAEDKGPQSRKFYLQLAELWPNGFMDNLGIKDAIYRSKERKRAMHRRNKVHGEERIKRKRLASAVRVDEASPAAVVRTGQERASIDSTGQILASPDKLISSQPPASSGQLADPAPTLSDSRYQESAHTDKVREGTAAATDLHKKMKRKSESEIEQSHGLPWKPPSSQGKERPKSESHGNEANGEHHPIPSLQQPYPPGSNRYSQA